MHAAEWHCAWNFYVKSGRQNTSSKCLSKSWPRNLTGGGKGREEVDYTTLISDYSRTYREELGTGSSKRNRSIENNNVQQWRLLRLYFSCCASFQFARQVNVVLWQSSVQNGFLIRSLHFLQWYLSPTQSHWSAACANPALSAADHMSVALEQEVQRFYANLLLL